MEPAESGMVVIKDAFPVVEVRALSSRSWALSGRPEKIGDTGFRLRLYDRFVRGHDAELEAKYGEIGRIAALGFNELLRNAAIYGTGRVSVKELELLVGDEPYLYYTINAEGPGFDPRKLLRPAETAPFMGDARTGISVLGGWGSRIVSRIADLYVYDAGGCGAYYAVSLRKDPKAVLRAA